MLFNDEPAAFEVDMFNKISMGVIIYDFRSGDVVFENQHFQVIAGEMESIIIGYIRRHLEEKKPLGVRNDIRISAKTVFGYTIYKISESRYLVFLNDISYKMVYFENREENKFYDKLSRLIAEVVHEVGNPLSSVTTTLQVLELNLSAWDEQKQREYLHRAVDSLEHLSRYLQLMREFSTGCEIRKRQVYLREIIENVITFNKLKLDFARIAVVCDVAPTVRVWVDEELMYKIILNLFLNSIHALDNPGEENSDKEKIIHLAIDEINSFYVKMTFRNNGPPIPREISDRVMLPFFNTDKKSPGIGLSLSMKLMIRMGGKIEFEPPPQGWGISLLMHIPISNDTG